MDIDEIRSLLRKSVRCDSDRIGIVKFRNIGFSTILSEYAVDFMKENSESSDEKGMLLFFPNKRMCEEMVEMIENLLSDGCVGFKKRGFLFRIGNAIVKITSANRNVRGDRFDVIVWDELMWSRNAMEDYSAIVGNFPDSKMVFASTWNSDNGEAVKCFSEFLEKTDSSDRIFFDYAMLDDDSELRSKFDDMKEHCSMEEFNASRGAIGAISDIKWMLETSRMYIIFNNNLK